MEGLPNETIMKIVSFLPSSEQVKFRAVCQRFGRLVSFPGVRKLVLKDESCTQDIPEAEYSRVLIVRKDSHGIYHRSLSNIVNMFPNIRNLSLYLSDYHLPLDHPFIDAIRVWELETLSALFLTDYTVTQILQDMPRLKSLTVNRWNRPQHRVRELEEITEHLRIL